MVPSHTAPETPGSIHEGGELGYSLSHAFGAAFDNPELIVACVVGDGEAETGPLATSWHSNKFLNPATDGAVLAWYRTSVRLGFAGVLLTIALIMGWRYYVLSTRPKIAIKDGGVETSACTGAE